MTEREYRDFLHSAKAAKREINSLMKSYKELDAEFMELTSPGAMDYSVDRVQSSSAPDALLINAISRIDEKKAKILERVQELNDVIEEVERDIDFYLDCTGDGITHEILRLYFLENVRMDEVAERIKYSVQRTWQFWRIGVDKCYEINKEVDDA